MDQLASATANASFSLASAAGNFSSLFIAQSSDSVSPGIYPNTITTSAASQVAVNEVLFTAGDVRPGIVQVQVTGTNVDDVGSASMYLQLDSAVFINCPAGSISRGQNSCIMQGNTYLPKYFPPTLPPPLQVNLNFTLGQPFSLSFSGSTDASGFGSIQANASNDLQFQFRFFEADGVTPVAVVAVPTPEPATFTVSGVALLVLAVAAGKTQRRNRTGLAFRLCFEDALQSKVRLRWNQRRHDSTCVLVTAAGPFDKRADEVQSPLPWSHPQ